MMVMAKLLSFLLLVLLLCSDKALAQRTIRRNDRGLRGTTNRSNGSNHNSRSTGKRVLQGARKMGKGMMSKSSQYTTGREDFIFNQPLQAQQPPPPTLPPQEYVPSTDRRDVVVAVQYYQGAQDVGWMLEKIDRSPKIPWLTSDVGDVSPGQAGRIVTQAQKGLFIGRYRITIINQNNDGISGGDGWLKVWDCTDATGVDINTLDANLTPLETTPGCKQVFYQRGNTGAVFFRDFDLN